MSFFTASEGSARNSSHDQLTGSCPPSIVKVHSASAVCGVGPADSTGKSCVEYCPGGNRPLSSPRPRPENPRETIPIPTSLSLKYSVTYLDSTKACAEARLRAGELMRLGHA